MDMQQPPCVSQSTSVPLVVADAAPRLRIQHHPGYSLVTLRGEFDVAARDTLRLELHEALHTCLGDRLLVDLAGVDFFDCTAVGVLVRAHQDADRLGVRLVLLGPRRPVRRLLEMTHIDRTIPTQPHLQAALSRPSTTADQLDGDRRLA